MRRPYASLSSSRADASSPSWYWRVLAYVASWSLLCGYLILPSLFDKEPQLRIPGIVLTVVAVGLLTLGVSVSILLFFACRNYLFRRDALFIPCFSASFLGLLTLLFHFVVSKRYEWKAAAIAGTIVSCVASVCYGLLGLWVNSEIATLKHQRNNSASHMPLREDTGYYSTDTFMTPVMPSQPTDSSPGIYVYPNGEAVQAMPLPAVGNENDDGTRNQLLSLLLRNDAVGNRERSPSNSSTYHIDLPPRKMTDDEMENLWSRVTPGQPRRVLVDSHPVSRREALAATIPSYSGAWEHQEPASFTTTSYAQSSRPSRASVPQEPPSAVVSGSSEQERTRSSSRPSDMEDDDEETGTQEGSTEPITLLPAARYVPKTTAAKRERRRQEIENGRNGGT